MKSPFSTNNSPANKPKRNVFDLSHSVHSTYGIGTLTPFLCQEVLPGDSVKLDTAFGIRAMPTAFPVQSRVRADVHYFYVRNRNLWKDWMNFIGKTGAPSAFPTLSKQVAIEQYKTGSLGDYLGVPTTVAGGASFPSGNIVFPYDNFAGEDYTPASPISSVARRFYAHFNRDALGSLNIGDANSPLNVIGSREYNSSSKNFTGYFSGLPFIINRSTDPSHTGTRINAGDTLTGVINVGTNIAAAISSKQVSAYLFRADTQLYSDTVDGEMEIPAGAKSPYLVPVKLSLRDFAVENSTSSLVTYRYRFVPSEDIDLTTPTQTGEDSGVLYLVLLSDISDGTAKGRGTWFTFTGSSSSAMPVVSPARVEATQLIDATQRFSADELPELSALPFRAYESIYNSFYRDQRNNPFVLPDGTQDPNVYCANTNGGPDGTYYRLYQRNWEQDQFTTAVPTPQQGLAPLVGVTSTGRATFASEDGTLHTVQLETSDGDKVDGVSYSTNLPSDVARSLVNVASSGFSISDFRGVNALTKWLEINMRRGLKYKDQLMSHFGVDASYAVLDMPEFLGGATRFFDSTQVNNNSGSSEDPLGSYAGQMSCLGESKHSVNRYFDEHGFLIGIICISPVPIYNQTLDKHFIKRDPLDYYFPEFGHLGYQPITYNEVAPLQALASSIALDDTFGYQRPWYDYMSKLDSSHGDFRTTLRGFLFGRHFDSVPSLTRSFLTIDPNDLNEVFTVTSVDGVSVQPFLGEVRLDMKMKRPIPRLFAPSLG